MIKKSNILIGTAVLMATAIIVAIFCKPDNSNEITTVKQISPPGNIAVKDASAEQLLAVVSNQNQAGYKTEMDYIAVIACCRQIQEQCPNSSVCEKAESFLKQVPKRYINDVDSLSDSQDNCVLKVKKSRSLRRTRKCNPTRFEIEREVARRLTLLHNKKL